MVFFIIQFSNSREILSFMRGTGNFDPLFILTGTKTNVVGIHFSKQNMPKRATLTATKQQLATLFLGPKND